MHRATAPPMTNGNLPIKGYKMFTNVEELWTHVLDEHGGHGIEELTAADVDNYANRLPDIVEKLQWYNDFDRRDTMRDLVAALPDVLDRVQLGEMYHLPIAEADRAWAATHEVPARDWACEVG